MIASFGGAVVKDDGTRYYSGSGGLIGGLSLPYAGTSNFTGAGKEYNSFTPYQSRADYNIEEPYYPGGGGGVGGGDTGGSVNPSGGGSGITTAPTTQLNLPQLSGGYRGYSGINTGGNIVTNALNSIFGSYQAGNINLQQALLYANQYAGYLNNPSYFYQAQHGDDAALLSRLKRTASGIIASISNWIRPETKDGNDTTRIPKSPPVNPTEIPIDLPPTLLQLLQGLGSSPRTNTEAAPNLFSFDPSATSGSSAPNNTMRNLILLGVVGFIGFWVYKKYWA